MEKFVERELRKMLPSCSMFINSNIEDMENVGQKVLLLPLIAALNSQNRNCIRLLLQYGANPHKICENMGESPRTFAKRRDFHGVPVLKMLSEADKLREKQLKRQS